jgi:hypothetical protein
MSSQTDNTSKNMKYMDPIADQLDSNDRKQLKGTLDKLGPVLSRKQLPEPAPATGNLSDLYHDCRPLFVLQAAMMMHDTKLRREFPNINKRYEAVSKDLFMQMFRKDEVAKMIVLALCAWKQGILS